MRRQFVATPLKFKAGDNSRLQIQKYIKHRFLQALKSSYSTSSIASTPKAINMSIDPPKPIKLYSNKSCPWAQRSRIALLEVGVKYEEVEIDLQNKPEWHWKLNKVTSDANQNYSW